MIKIDPEEWSKMTPQQQAHLLEQQSLEYAEDLQKQALNRMPKANKALSDILAEIGDIHSVDNMVTSIVAVFIRAIKPHIFNPTSGTGNRLVTDINAPALTATNIFMYWRIADHVLSAELHEAVPYVAKLEAFTMGAFAELIPTGDFKANYGFQCQTVFNLAWNAWLDSLIYEQHTNDPLSMEAAYHLRLLMFDALASVAHMVGGRTAQREFSLAARPLCYKISRETWEARAKARYTSTTGEHA